MYSQYTLLFGSNFQRQACQIAWLLIHMQVHIVCPVCHPLDRDYYMYCVSMVYAAQMYCFMALLCRPGCSPHPARLLADAGPDEADARWPDGRRTCLEEVYASLPTLLGNVRWSVGSLIWHLLFKQLQYALLMDNWDSSNNQFMGVLIIPNFRKKNGKDWSFAEVFLLNSGKK